MTMRSSYGTVTRKGGVIATPTPIKPKTCNPTSSISGRSESNGDYQVVVVDNDCSYKVKFQYVFTPVIGNEPARTPWTGCALAETTGSVVGRSSSIRMARLQATQKYKKC